MKTVFLAVLEISSGTQLSVVIITDKRTVPFTVPNSPM